MPWMSSCGGPNPPEPLFMTDFPQGPCQSIAIDFMGPLSYTDYVFAVTDYFSQYVEVSTAQKNTADVAINTLRKCLRLMVCPTQVLMVLISWQNLLKNS